MAATITSAPARPVWSLIIGVVFAYSLASIAAHPLLIPGDCALHIEAAEKILSGGLAGVDAVDTNPPLIMLITTVPTAFAHLIGMHPIPVFLVFVWLFTVATTFGARQLLADALSAREAIHADFLGVALAVVSCVLQMGDMYGQREYLFIFGVMPYLVIRFRRWEGIPVSSAAAIGWGVIAGIAASIKPQLALIVLVPEVYWLFTRRNLGPLMKREVYGAVSAAAAYLAYLVLIPEVRRFVLGRWVPLLVHGYAAYDIPWISLLTLQSEYWRAAGLAFLPFVLRGRPDDVAWRLMRPLATALAMAAVVYIVQHKGWPYHALPVSVLAYALAGLMLAQSMTRAADSEPSMGFTSLVRSRTWVLALALVVSLSVGASLLALGPSSREAEIELVRDYPMARGIASYTNEGDSVLFLSTSVVDPYPVLVQMRRHQASRTMFAFPIALMYWGVQGEAGRPFPYRGVNGIDAPLEERRYREDLSADIQKTRPKIIMIDATRRCLACPEEFSLVEYFEQTGFMTALTEYAPSSQIDKFKVYQRKD